MKYLILAVGDISLSEKNSAKDERLDYRNITVETDESIWNITSAGANGSMKYILKQIEPAAEELITAFEFEGSVSKKIDLDYNSLVGCCLVVNNPDVYRGILLLKSHECQIIRSNDSQIITTNNTTSSSSKVFNIINDITSDKDDLGDDLIEELLYDEFSLTK